MKNLNKGSFLTVLTTAFVGILLGVLVCSCKKCDEKIHHQLIVSNQEMVLKLKMRELWLEHALCTRNVIFCIVDKLPGTDVSTKRLFQNQIDLGDALKPYFGNNEGDMLTQRLVIHVQIASEIILALKNENQEDYAKANQKWQANANEIAVFLNKLMPSLVTENLKMMLNEHLILTTDEAVQRVKKDYTADMKSFDKVQISILKMSDMITDGLIKTFPEKFRIHQEICQSSK
jgi:hypothetical protein